MTAQRHKTLTEQRACIVELIVMLTVFFRVEHHRELR